MVRAMDEISEAKKWDQQMLWVWVDVISIPQRCRGMQRLAINSLSMYASVAHAFAIVAPAVRHANTGQILDAETYKKRMWCEVKPTSLMAEIMITHWPGVIMLASQYH